MKRAVAGWQRDAAVLRVDEPTAVEIGDLGMTAADVWRTEATPPDLRASLAADYSDWRLEPSPAGTVFRIVTFEPGATTGAHATQTLDYLVVVAGRISLVVGDDEVVLESGDAVVLNGAPHDWINRSDAPCTLAAILVSAVQCN